MRNLSHPKPMRKLPQTTHPQLQMPKMRHRHTQPRIRLLLGSDVLMKSLILIPVYNCGKTLPALFSFLYKLKPQPDLFVFAENNSEDNTLKVITKFKRPNKIIRVWFRDDAAVIGESRYEPIAHIRQLLLTFARRFEPDYAIFLDSDVYPRSRDLIDRLSLWQKDLVGGAYSRLFPQGMFIASKWSTPDGKKILMKKKSNLPLDMPNVTSAGCLCLNRRILQDKRVNFYPLIKGASEDFGYCLQARFAGYNVYLDGTLHLHHIIPRKMPKKPWLFDSKQNRCIPFFYGKNY
jgi:GT2 family glycosyltransferase